MKQPEDRVASALSALAFATLISGGVLLKRSAMLGGALIAIGFGFTLALVLRKRPER